MSNLLWYVFLVVCSVNLCFEIYKLWANRKTGGRCANTSTNSQRDATCPHWMRGPDGDPIYKCAYHPDLVTCGIEPCINKRAS